MKRFSGHEEHLDTELNIVPIIDCFVMLICFLLFTAAFTQLVYLETKLTSNTAVAANKSRSELDQFRLVISMEDEGLRLKTTGSNSKGENVFLPKLAAGYNFKALHEQIITMKIANPDRFSADIEIKAKHQENIVYDQLTAAVDTIRHLNDEEYGALRVAEKKMNKMDLSGSEQDKQVPDSLDKLAHSLLADNTAKNTDQKLLFPDIAIIGIN